MQLPKNAQEFSEYDEWILELESPFNLYSGRLGYMGPSVPGTARIEMDVGASFEREGILQASSLELRGAGLPHPPFRFRIFYSDFIKIFW